MTYDLTGVQTLPILTDADPMLKRVSTPIGQPTDETRALAMSMLATMYAAPGIGLAAVQIGHLVRMLVFDAGTPQKPQPTVMIDPVVEWAKKRCIEMTEGCLSLPGKRIDVSRPTDVKVSYTDLDGTRQTRDLGGMPARVFQHELDHLNGIMIDDHLG